MHISQKKTLPIRVTKCGSGILSKDSLMESAISKIKFASLLKYRTHLCKNVRDTLMYVLRESH